MTHELIGTHVRLRTRQPDDAPALLSASADGKLWDLPYTIVPDANNIEGYIASALTGLDAGTGIPYVVECANDAHVIGTTRFVHADFHARTIEISHTWLAARHQGTLANTDMKYLMLAFAFETLECIRVQLRADTTNLRSRRAIEKIGAVAEGVLRHERMMPDGRKRDAVLYSIIDSDWPDIRQLLLARIGAR